MKAVFTSKDIRKIGDVLGTEGKLKGNNYRFEVVNREAQRTLAFEIYPDIPIGKKNGNLISAYTHNTHFQLHFCSGYVVSKLLGEVTFIGENNGKVSAIIIEREGGCTFYANVERSLLSGDFTQLGPEVMLAGIALSLTEDILPRSLSSPVKKKKTK